MEIEDLAILLAAPVRAAQPGPPRTAQHLSCSAACRHSWWDRQRPLGHGACERRRRSTKSSRTHATLTPSPACGRGTAARDTWTRATLGRIARFSQVRRSSALPVFGIPGVRQLTRTPSGVAFGPLSVSLGITNHYNRNDFCVCGGRKVGIPLDQYNRSEYTSLTASICCRRKDHYDHSDYRSRACALARSRRGS